MPLLSPEEEEKQLLLRVSRGDREAFSILFYAYNTKLYSFIYRITGSQAISEDILQDVFLKIWNTRDRLREVNNFSAFIFTVARHHALNQLRRMARETLMKSLKPRTELNENTPDKLLQFKNLESAIAEIVDTLPPRQQTAYKLSREQHLKQEAIALKMKISLSTVQNHLNRALHTIREQLEKRYPLSSLLIFWLIRFLG